MNLSKTAKTNLTFAGIAGVLVLAILLWAWFSAPSTVSVPKGEQYEKAANIEKQNAVISETQANAIRDQRIEANRDTTQARTNLKNRQDTYEKVRKAPTVINNSNLDARERQLQSDLERLYPANR